MLRPHLAYLQINDAHLDTGEVTELLTAEDITYTRTRATTGDQDKDTHE